MPAGFNTYSNISSFVNTIYEDALLVARDTNLATNLVTVFNDRTGMAVRSLQEYGTATINAIAETDDLVSQVFTPSALATLTPAEYGAQFLLTDQRVESDPFGVRQDAAVELGAAMAESIDVNVFSNFTGLTGGTVGNAGSAITWSYFFAMLARLRAGKVPLNRVSFVCHPYQWSVLAKAASIASTGGSVNNTPEYVREQVARSYYVQSISGVDIFVSANVPMSGGTAAYCAMFNPLALAYDERRAPRIEPERDASRRAWELNLSGVYAHGVWRPKWGIQGIFDATAPTT